MSSKDLHRAIVSVEKSYSGPLPSPSDFAAYKQVLPSAPERIMQMAENIQKHRIESEMRLIKIRSYESIFGMTAGFVLVLACLGLVYLLAMNEHDALAITVVGITAVIASIFVLKFYPKKTDNK